MQKPTFVAVVCAIACLAVGVALGVVFAPKQAAAPPAQPVADPNSARFEKAEESLDRLEKAGVSLSRELLFGQMWRRIDTTITLDRIGEIRAEQEGFKGRKKLFAKVALVVIGDAEPPPYTKYLSPPTMFGELHFYLERGYDINKEFEAEFLRDRQLDNWEFVGLPKSMEASFEWPAKPGPAANPKVKLKMAGPAGPASGWLVFWYH